MTWDLNPPLNTNKTMTYDMGSQPSPPLDKNNWTSKGNYKYKQTLKKLQIFATTQKCWIKYTLAWVALNLTDHNGDRDTDW